MATLNRVQSGIGLLTIEALWSGAQVGCAYTLVGGQSSIVCHSAGLPCAPPTSRNPIILARTQKFDRLTVDLRQTRRLARLIVYGSAAVGTLAVSTFSGARIEIPLNCSDPGVTVFLSIYNLDGELTIRAEPPYAAPSVRQACASYGLDRITWRDDNTPAT